MTYLFADRTDAGKKLGARLEQRHFKKPVVLALPRGGVIIAEEVAKLLQVPVDVVIARKIGAPGQPEFGIGAISEDEIPSYNQDVLDYVDTNSPTVKRTVQEEKEELRRRVKLYRGGHHLPDMKDKTVVVVDDGLATGVTAISAAKYLRTLHPHKIILAIPVGPSDLGREVSESYDEIICLYSLDNLRSVGMWYQSFDQVEDEEVLEVLRRYH